ncbi:MAG TPA: SulP family inorganic anion transporter [Anaerolineae bacterium]|nr:SulP family inorganic anion transporter [Anaerolineae bacterium]
MIHSPLSMPMQGWLRSLPVFLTRPARIVRHYRREDVRPDLIAGLTVAVVLLPQAIAYALIAELPPQTGLYAAIVASIVGALWGSSFHLHTGPTNAASLLVLSTLIGVASPGSPEWIAAAGLMAVMVGAARLAMGLARMGVLANFVSMSVVVGFTAGAGILIIVNQLRHLFRLDEVPSLPELHVTLVEIARHISQLHGLSLAMGLGTMAVIVGLRRSRPSWPGALIGMTLASTVVAVLDLDRQGVQVMGELPRSLPPLASLPLFDITLIGRLSTGALAIAVIGLVEAISIARSIAAQSGQHVDSNQEFVGQGLANVAAGFFSGYTCSGSFTRSALLYTTGGRTPLASVFSGIWTLLAALLFAPLAGYLPRAALAGMLIVMSYTMIDRVEIGRILRASIGDSLIMIATFVATLLLPLEFAVLVGVIASFARYIIQTSMPGVYSVLPDDEFRHFVHRPEKLPCPQLGVIAIQGSLYFGATHHVEEAIRANFERNPGQRFLLLKMNLVTHCDVSGIHMLESVVRLYRQHGGDVFMVRVRGPVRTKMRLTGFEEMLGTDHILPEDSAIGHLFYKVLDPAVCIYECPARAWLECQNLPKYPYPEAAHPSTLLPSGVAGQALGVSPAVDVPEISPADLRRRLLHDHPSPLVVDVREPREFKQGHIPQAQLVPLPKLLTAAPGDREGSPLLPRDRDIVLVCRTGRRSMRAAATLQLHGYRRLRILGGGILAWEAAGLLEALDDLR